MTTGTTALRALIEAVEAGKRGLGLNTAAVFGDNQTAMDAVDAFDGSLDAAKALHDALLPGWRVENVSQHDNGAWWVSLHRPVQGDDLGNITLPGATVAVFDNPNPARAWLLAILKAKLGAAE